MSKCSLRVLWLSTIFLFITFIHIISGYIFNPRLEEQTDNFINSVHNYIPIVSEHADGDLAKEKAALIDSFNKLNPIIRRHSVLPELNGTEYKDIINEIRFNYQRYTQLHSRFTLVFIFLSVVATSIQFFFIRQWNKAQYESLRDVEAGVEAIKNMLEYRSYDKGFSIDSTNKEVNVLYSYLRSIENEIIFDKKLIETSLNGNLNDTIRELSCIISKEMDCDRLALSFLNSSGNITVETYCTTYSEIFLNAGYSYPVTDLFYIDLNNIQPEYYDNNLIEFLSKVDVPEVIQLYCKEGLKSSISYPIVMQNKCVGFLHIGSLEKGAYTEKNIKFGRRVVSLMKHKFFMEYILQDTIARTTDSFVGLMNYKDNETAEHIIRMSHYSSIIAKRYAERYKHIPPGFVREIMWFAPLHDVGKIGIPDAILLKPGRFDKDEWEEMKTHVTIGENVIKQLSDNVSVYFTNPAMQTAMDIIKTHHEKYDGTGYPYGIKGEDIPLAGRIVALADVFDALTSKRSYKDAYTIEESIRIIESEMAGHFDPKVYNCFIDSLESIKEIYEEYKEV